MPTRHIIIGDVHGCYDELLRLLDKVGATDDDVVVSVGDLVDRGPESTEVCDFFRAREGAVVLMGNHERKHVRGVRSYAQEIVRVQMGERYDELVAWMAGFPYYVELDEALIVHAAFEHDVALEAQREDVLAGTTSGERHLESRYGDGYWTEAYAGEKPIIFGHHVVGDEVKVWNDRVYGIDTGACHGGRLSALVLPEFRIVQVNAAGDFWAAEKIRWQAPVLAAKPWAEMTWAKIEREIERASGRATSEVTALLDAIGEWLGELMKARGHLAKAIADTASRLIESEGEAGFGRAAAAHPGSGWLFRHRRDPISAGDVGDACPSPSAILALADKFGVEVRSSPTLPAM